MFLPTRGTAYDLRFSLLGIPVTVSPFFWVTAGLLGFQWLQIEPGGPANLIAWVLCVFVSIIVHEFGHALTMRAFGHDPEVVLHHFGGYAAYRDRGRETPLRSLLISAAGPAIQFVLFLAITGSAVWVVRDRIDWMRLLDPDVLLNIEFAIPSALARAGYFEVGTPLFAIVSSLLFINLYWPLVNLLPVLPLDGGRMLHAILGLFGVRGSTDWTLKVSVFVGVIAAVYFLLMTQNFLAGAMFAFMAMDNYQTLKGQQMGSW